VSGDKSGAEAKATGLKGEVAILRELCACVCVCTSLFNCGNHISYDFGLLVCGSCSVISGDQTSHVGKACKSSALCP
jgi:hypothetical protein